MEHSDTPTSPRPLEEHRKVHGWEIPRPDTSKDLDDKADILHSIGKIHGKAYGGIKEDYVLAKFAPKEREFVIEMYSNAVFFQAILKRYHDSTKDEGKRKQIKIIMDESWKKYMAKIDMIAYTGRNQKNDLIEYLTGAKTKEPDEIITQDDTLIKRIANRLKPQHKEDEK